MTDVIRAPAERTCTRCGRSEAWNDATVGWQVDDDVGDVHCIHSWDITGTFTPVEQ